MTNPKQSKTLHVERLGEELSVYDWKRLQMHSLNPTAASAFELCDGETSPEQMAAKLDAPKELIWQSLAELDKANLLEIEAEKAFWQKDISRRQFLKAGSAVAAAAIVSIMLPSPAAAQSAPATATPTTTPPTPTPIPPSGPITRTVTIGTLPVTTPTWFAFTSAITDAMFTASSPITTMTISWTGDPAPASTTFRLGQASSASGGPLSNSSFSIQAGVSSQNSADTNDWTGGRPYNGFQLYLNGTASWNAGDMTVSFA